MLWKKETGAASGTLYVDLFEMCAKAKDLQKGDQIKCKSFAAPPKSDLVSLEKRKKGNEFFAEREWSSAMEMYNESLCYAEQGSPNISLAYGNRSACFLHLKLYGKCLADIELAKQTGYPSNMMPKLEQRKAECLKHMKSNMKSDEYQYKLSYEPNKKYPCMANVLKIEQDDDGKYSVIAKKDLDTFETVLFEDLFSKFLYARFGMKCNICLKSNANLVPCENCTIAMFCGDECQGNSFHEYECGLKFSEDKEQNSQVLSEVRRLLMAINLFPNVDDLANFVEKTIENDTKQLPKSMNDEKVKYESYLQYPVDETFVKSTDFVAIVLNTFNLVLNIQKIRAMFNSEKHRRFLMHLIGHHVGISKRNVLHSGDKRKGGPGNYYNYVPLMSQYFEQAFAPSLLMYEDNNKMVYVTSGKIKKGEHLTIHYLGDPNDPNAPKYKPRETTNNRPPATCHYTKLKSNCKAGCKCTRCGPPPSAEVLSSDADLGYIIDNMDALLSDRNGHQELVNRLDLISKKHGPNMMMFGNPKPPKK